VYGLTTYADMAAPLAGAFVSSAMMVGKLAKQYRAGEIDFDEFVCLGQLACAEGAVVGLASAAGQALIPIPAVGALVGAVAGRWLASMARDHLAGDDARLATRLKEEHDALVSRLDTEIQRAVDRLIAIYDKLGDLTAAAFDMTRNVNLRVAASIELARAYDVSELDILHNEGELDDFMLA